MAGHAWPRFYHTYSRESSVFSKKTKNFLNYPEICAFYEEQNCRPVSLQTVVYSCRGTLKTEQMFVFFKCGDFISVLPHGSRPAIIRAAGTRKTEKRIRVEIQGGLCPKEGKSLFSPFFTIRRLTVKPQNLRFLQIL